MRTTNLSFPLAATMATAIALMSISCGKDEKTQPGKVGTKGMQKSGGGGSSQRQCGLKPSTMLRPGETAQPTRYCRRGPRLRICVQR